MFVVYCLGKGLSNINNSDFGGEIEAFEERVTSSHPFAFICKELGHQALKK